MWRIETNKCEVTEIPWNGNRFLNGNGYMGVRGTLCEYTKEQMCAVNLAGIYDEAIEGCRETVNAPNGLYTYIKVDGVKYALPDVVPYEHIQGLDFESGIQYRKTSWKTTKGIVSLECRRFASMHEQHYLALEYSVCVDYPCEINIITGIDGDVWDLHGNHFSEFEISEQGNIKHLKAITREKKTEVNVREKATYDFEGETEAIYGEKKILSSIKTNAEKNRKYTMEKIIEVTTSEDSLPLKSDLCDTSYSLLLEKQREKWRDIWNISKITIEGDDEAMQAINYSIYHLNCIAPRNIENMSIAARGLSGQVYKGAVFWDTEMFMIDYYIHTEPEIAKNLIKYRISTLEGARKKAKEYNLKGAYYAWESQDGGREACELFKPFDVFTKRPVRAHFRDSQYHVSAAVVYGIVKYLNATEDFSILIDGGAEVIIECARMYRSLLLKKADSTLFEIHDVVGPDEYHERVNNNAYTNKMVQFVFKTAVSVIDNLKKDYQYIYDVLDARYDLKFLANVFETSAENLYIPAPDKKTNIIEQFDGYLSLENVFVKDIKERLLNDNEYWGGACGVAVNTQVLKQADIVAMLCIFKDDYTSEVLESNWEYYEPRTEHGSSLSACMYSLLGCYIGKTSWAYPLFMKSAQQDLNSGSKEWLGMEYIGGTHPASAGGAWLVAINGFAGIGIADGQISCTPNLPEKWSCMEFKYRFRQKLYNIRISDKVKIDVIGE